MYKKQTNGFTLIEVMIVVGILGIVSAIAIPSYTEYVRKGKRTDAKVELLRLSQIQESYFVQNLSYARDFTTAAGGLGLGDDVESEQGSYIIEIESQNAAGGTCDGTATDSCASYTMTASPQGGQADDGCNDFTLTNTGVKDIDGESAGYDAQRCWR